MITKWRLFNFKSVKSDTSLDFGPLTIFAGPNSSGKSTCIQSLLLICQTLRNQVGSRSVILNGTLTRLGQFSDLKSFESDANQILIGWEIQPSRTARGAGQDEYMPWVEDGLLSEEEDDPLVSVTCDVAFDAKTDVPNDPTQLNPQLFSTVIRGRQRNNDGVDQLTVVGLSRSSDSGEQALSRLRNQNVAESDLDRVRSAVGVDIELDESSKEQIKRRYISGNAIGCDLIHFLPSRIAVAYEYAEEQSHMLISVIFGTARVPTFRWRAQGRDLYIPVAGLKVLARVVDGASGTFFENQTPFDRLLLGSVPVSLTQFQDALRSLSLSQRRHFQEALQNKPASQDEFAAAVRQEFEQEHRTAFVTPSSGLQASCKYVRLYFSQAVRYLGPLRDEPKALYPLATGLDPLDVGLQGENTAAVLDLHKGKLIRFIPPSAFAQPVVSRESVVRTLQIAVGEWLKHLGVAENVESVDKGKLGHELKVSVDQHSGQQDLTHVGVGVSQVLPILVMCLLAEKDSVLTFEQPELHLHPKIQTLLGDFFLSMTLMDRQCIIETHSEYLINRLRFRAATATGNDVASRIKMYFVEKHDGASTFRQVKVNAFGAIEDWPEGFFDQSQREAEATLKAAMRKRRDLKAEKG